MKYELAFIEILVRKEIFTELKNQSLGQSKNTLLIFDDEIRRIKIEWRNHVFSATDERSIERYIQDHQKVLIELTNHVLDQLGDNAEKMYSNTADDNQFGLYRSIYKGLEDLLAFIEKYFSKYFDQESKVPDSYKWIAYRDFREQVPGIRNFFLNNNLEKRLLALALYPVDQFLEKASTREVTFRKLIFLKTLIKELEKMSRQNLEGNNLEEQLKMLLFYLDYNSLRAFNYATDFINSYVAKAETLSDRVERLAYAQKCINQAQIKPGFSYNPDYKPIKEQLSDWITEEIHFVEKRQQLSLHFKPGDTEFIKKDFKLALELSVAQLACFIRLLVETKIIQNKNIQDVLRFVSKSVRTRKAENIAHSSLYSKFYNIEESARTAIKDMLIKLLNQVRRK